MSNFLFVLLLIFLSPACSICWWLFLAHEREKRKKEEKKSQNIHIEQKHFDEVFLKFMMSQDFDIMQHLLNWVVNAYSQEWNDKEMKLKLIFMTVSNQIIVREFKMPLERQSVEIKINNFEGVTFSNRANWPNQNHKKSLF